MMKEELNYMKYLFGYQRGKVISEQTVTWRKGSTIHQLSPPIKKKPTPSPIPTKTITYTPSQTPVPTPIPSQPIVQPQPTPVPTPIPSKPIVQPPTIQTEPIDDNYPSYQPHIPKRSIGYDPVGKTISPFDNLQKSDKQYGRGKIHSRRTNSDGFYTKLSKRMKEADNYYNGYYNDNDEYVPGEIQKAEQNKRRIKFLEPLTREDRQRQETYNKEYNEYLKTRNLTSNK